jgi:hypothetical protein
MTSQSEVVYVLGSDWGKHRRAEPVAPPTLKSEQNGDAPVARIARLMALAIRFEGLLREESFRDYAELARLGSVTRARITQIMKLLLLAPDIQEQILFLPPARGINERNLRPIVNLVDWGVQRRIFDKIRS